MKKRAQKLEPIQTMTKTEASYQRLMLNLLSKLVDETRESNQLMKEHFWKGQNRPIMARTNIDFKDKMNVIAKRESQQQYLQSYTSPKKANESIIIEVEQSQSGNNIHQRALKSSASSQKFQLAAIQREERLQAVLQGLDKRMQTGEQVAKKLLQKIQHMNVQKEIVQSSKMINQNKLAQRNMIQQALADKLKTATNLNNQIAPNQKKSYVILSQILPYSDRRQMKVKFKISDIVKQEENFTNDDIRTETSEWLGMVYRATASICWNMLLNNSLNFEQVKILFTENIVFNFIQFMNELDKMGKNEFRQKLTEQINQKSVDILDFLCRQYPQTKIEAPNIALRKELPQIDNQGRIKYDLVCNALTNAGISFTFQEDGDYTAQIMKLINYIIDQTTVEYDQYLSFMKDTFEEVYLPFSKRKQLKQAMSCHDIKDMDNQNLNYKEKVKSYTKYLIGRKISKNTSKYTPQQIEDGIFFVKSSGILRIITKWVQQLMEYFTNSQQKIKNSYSQTKDHNGNLIYISALLKNGIHKQIQKDKTQLMKKIQQIKKQCYKMELLLTGKSFTSDETQVHLSEEQITVGLYCSNLKSAISSYICSQLNELIHYLLKVPREVSEDDLQSNLDDFKSQARKDLDSLNLVSFKLFDLLRCKIHSNQEEIIWIVRYLIQQSKTNKDKFHIVRIKDRLNLGTRDIMINAQINKGLVCEIQLSVTSNSDKKQELLDQYNHFLYELKRSKLGPITENVSIWSTLEQRFSYFEQLMKQKAKQKPKIQNLKHQCGIDNFINFKRPIICQCCNNFYAIPKTCLLNVQCKLCNMTLCGQCYYYKYLTPQQRKIFIFDKHKLFKADVLDKLKQYTDFENKPLPATGFFIKKKFLKKQLSFYMAIEKNKQQNVKDAPSIQLIIIQTIIRDDIILNRQVNKKQIQARLEKGEFYVKNYTKTQLNNFIIFYFEKKQNKKLMTLKDIEAELKKQEHRRTKVLSIVREPSYINDLKLLKKDTEKNKEMSNLVNIIHQDKITVFMFNNLFILAQACVKGSLLRAQITKKVNTSSLKGFAYKQSDIVSMQHKNMTTQLDDLSFKIKPDLYSMFCRNIKKMFLSNGNIVSLKCFSNFYNLQFIVISENKLTTLEGIQQLKYLTSFRFDSNNIESLEPCTNLTALKYLSGNKNKIVSLKGLQNLKDLKNLSLYQNQISNIQELKEKMALQQLYLRQNPISDLSIIESLIELKKLFIGKTKITKVPDITGLSKLKSLSLQSLGLTQIPNVFFSIRLAQLWLSHNNITSIKNLEQQNEMIMLNLSNNQIAKLQNISKLQKLQVLKLENNKIKVIQGVKDLDSLKLLNLKLNPIDDLGELTKYQITFNYELTEQFISQKAKQQRIDIETNKQNLSSGDD